MASAGAGGPVNEDVVASLRTIFSLGGYTRQELVTKAEELGLDLRRAEDERGDKYFIFTPHFQAAFLPFAKKKDPDAPLILNGLGIQGWISVQIMPRARQFMGDPKSYYCCQVAVGKGKRTKVLPFAPQCACSLKLLFLPDCPPSVTAFYSALHEVMDLSASS